MRTRRPLAALLSLFALTAAAVPAAPVRAADALPPGEAAAPARLEKSPRHGEYVDVKVPNGKPLKAYVVYPERKDKAPVVIVIHEIFGLSPWIKSVADQLAADGFIAIAPDLLTGMAPEGKGTEGFAKRDDVVQAVRGLKPDQVVAGLNAVRDYGKGLPSSSGKSATVGFCWGGGQSFSYALAQPELSAAVVYYGTNPGAEAVANLKVPVAGFYGGNDNRVNSTIPPAQEAAKKAGKTYEPTIYEGAGHGFLRQQDGQNGANQKATEQAWPATLKFLREHTK
ncbi:MAG TPA: dienelactone hydrolase family protein [Humisphaera sp.]